MRNKASNNFILKNIDSFNNTSLLIVGDIGLDEYIFGHANRLSPEAPVPVLEVEEKGFHLGLSGNVALNVKTLGGNPILLTVTGEDEKGQQIRKLLQVSGISPEHLLIDSKRPTTHKVRVMAQQHHLVRIDYEKKYPLSKKLEEAIIKRARELLPECAGMVLQDYAKGVLNASTITQLIQIARSQNKKILLDPHRTSKLIYYKGVDLMTPNHEEAIALSGITTNGDYQEDLLAQAGEKLMGVTGSSRLIITRAQYGMRLFEKNRIFDLPTYARQVFDVTGAGDTVIAMLSLAWLSGFSLRQACIASNFAAGVVVGKPGCVPCKRKELIEYIQNTEKKKLY